MDDDMFAAPVPITDDKLSISQSSERVKDYARKALAENTWQGYEHDLEHFTAWGGSIPCSPDVIAAYIADHAGILAVSTLTRRLAAINKAHEMKNHLSPTKDQKVRLVMRGIRREHSTQQKQAAPLLRDDLISICAHMPDDNKGKRDKALLLIGFSAALRRSELVALNIEDIEFTPEGLIVNIRKSKTDQEAVGHKIAVPKAKSQGRVCPVQAFHDWLDCIPSAQGALFRSFRKNHQVQEKRLSASAVSVIIKEHVEKIGLEPEKFSAHSLRAGCISSLAQIGIPEWKIMRQSRHKSYTVMMSYIRDARLFENHPLDSLF
jgi:integrase